MKIKAVLILLIAGYIGVKLYEAAPRYEQFDASASVSLTYNEPGLNELNAAAARKTNAEAAQIEQQITDAREAKDGYALNVLARVVRGTGNTDAEQLISAVFSTCGLLLALAVAMAFLLVMARKPR